VVVAPDGRILCQLRDDKPGVIARGLWTCSPGGGVEEGETPLQAIVREMREEFEIDIGDVRLLLVHVEEQGEASGVYHAFTATLLTPLADVKCNEGVRAEFFEPNRALALPQHPVSKIILSAYLQNRT
jgi:8-oxo-dGTP pyrophosphatase MutT (NUDIX family)